MREPVDGVDEFEDSQLNESVLYAVETWWYKHKKWPRSAEIAGLLKVSIGEVEDAYDRVSHHLRRRGVDRMLKTGEFTPERLDPFRHDVAVAISNIHDPKRLEAKLRSLKISETQYRGWLQDPMFSDFVLKRSEDLVHEELPEVSRNLLRKASRGDLRATKMVLELTGKLASAKSTQVNVFQDKSTSLFVIKQLVDVIKRHVRDPEILEKIAYDFDKIMGAGTASNGMSLEAGSFEDKLANGEYAVLPKNYDGEFASANDIEF